jgi:alpha-tubulin suppressor-like RCC1 family protein
VALSRSQLALLGGLALTACITEHEVLRPSDGGPPPSDAPFVAARGLSAGVDHTCRLDDGVVACTGSNLGFALGLPDGADRLVPEPVPRLTDAERVEAGYGFTCALRAGGRVACFGRNGSGQLGTGDFGARSAPTEVFLPGPVASVSAAFDHACAILRSGALHCWGSNAEHELGQGEPVPSDRPVPVEVLPGTGFVEVSAGQGHTCAIAIDGTTYCTGRNQRGECGLGPGTPEQVVTPMPVPGHVFVHVASGQNHTCAIAGGAEAGALFCWGDDFDADGHPGPLALPGAGPHFVPERVGTFADWTAISTDTFHTCGLRAGGELWCWGRNAEGQLGAGSMDVVPEPFHVEPGTTFESVDVGRFHTCARRSDGVVLCAGKNTAGELGVGDLERRTVFTQIE